MVFSEVIGFFIVVSISPIFLSLFFKIIGFDISFQSVLHKREEEGREERGVTEPNRFIFTNCFTMLNFERERRREKGKKKVDSIYKSRLCYLDTPIWSDSDTGTIRHRYVSDTPAGSHRYAIFCPDMHTDTGPCTSVKHMDRACTRRPVNHDGPRTHLLWCRAIDLYHYNNSYLLLQKSCHDM